MDYTSLWENKKTVARATMHKKEQIHGILCQVEVLEEFKDIHGEESSQKAYYAPASYKLVFLGITGNTMLSLSEILSSTENEDMFIQRYEGDALLRNSRVTLPQGTNNKYRTLEIRDTIKNEGSYIILQRVVPTIIKDEVFNDALGRNLVEDTPVGRNL